MNTADASVGAQGPTYLRYLTLGSWVWRESGCAWIVPAIVASLALMAGAIWAAHRCRSILLELQRQPN